MLSAQWEFLVLQRTTRRAAGGARKKSSVISVIEFQLFRSNGKAMFLSEINLSRKVRGGHRCPISTLI
jgi:hypothetical protein